MADVVDFQIFKVPVSPIYDYLSNPENRTNMFVKVIEVNKLNDTIGVGARYEEIREISGHRVSSELEIVELVENDLIVFSTKSNGMKVIYTYSFRKRETDEGISVVFEGEVIGESLRTKLFRFLLARMMKKEDGDHLQVVKKELEK
ncbi:hypothetical protein [Evansella cellulosilytica]|uniref:Polyketide cyclase / dehydrase and lipid transport n=1 Tax=Evansella cellulosilytica (strain ATCC 21833 / DSM 2522 / FERM P-1141 / JCM 9156 / N-4) TaxID=649639 RepID=E6TRZ4_EVAC2|nr:hypothetical protein [Evansella cellulosilytica]ADU30648.1 hypothetical protein Bcell_2390 [Evansella cellulosilytica DSM 2522]